MKEKINCPNCNGNRLKSFFTLNEIPVHSNIMLKSKKEALNFPTGNLKLAYCTDCGFITNVLFNSTLQAYTSEYEVEQTFSPTFNVFAKRFAEHLLNRFDLKGKTVIEIGCGRGDFLALLCHLGNCQGIGIDPSATKERLKATGNEKVQLISEYYSEKHADIKGDLILCRHTLEHIDNTYQFLQTLRNTIGGNLHIPVVFEVPETIRVLSDIAFEDIYYEHCSYFTPGSLARLFRFTGFEILDIYLDYDDQYLFIEAKPVNGKSQLKHEKEETVETLIQAAKSFEKRINEKISSWQNYLAKLKKDNSKIIIWGSGSKCVSFITTMGLKNEIDYIVDINPYRHGNYIPGLGKDIKSPEYLKKEKPDLVIVMNPIYKKEIGEMISGLGVETKIMNIDEI